MRQSIVIGNGRAVMTLDLRSWKCFYVHNKKQKFFRVASLDGAILTMKMRFSQPII